MKSSQGSVWARAIGAHPSALTQMRTLELAADGVVLGAGGVRDNDAGVPVAAPA